MLLSYHLPIIDLRPMLSISSHKLDDPKWQLPRNEVFVRGFGKVKDRNLGGDDYFGGGSRVFGAHGVIRFKSTDPKIALPGDKFFKVDCKFRRFFAFSDQTAKIELGLTQKSKKPADKLSADPVAIQSILEGLFDLPVSIMLTQASSLRKTAEDLKKKADVVDGSLGGIGNNIASALLRASTSLQDAITTESWWIQIGKPIAFLELNAEEPFMLPLQVQKLDCSDNDVDVYTIPSPIGMSNL